MATKTLFTVEQFEQLPEEEAYKYELVRGELIEVSSASVQHSYIRDGLGVRMVPFAQGRGNGMVIWEHAFRLAPDTVRRPDLTYLAQESVAGAMRTTGIIPFAPLLAVEVVSPSDKLFDVFEKAQEYLAAGSRKVWLLIRQPVPEVIVFDSSGAQVVLRADDILEAPEILPGFRVRVGDLFEMPKP